MFQSSDLDCLIFSMCIIFLGDFIQVHNFEYLLYVDDFKIDPFSLYISPSFMCFLISTPGFLIVHEI